MIWFFERQGKYVRCETRKTADGAYELVTTKDDGTEDVERFDDSANAGETSGGDRAGPDGRGVDRPARPRHVGEGTDVFLNVTPRASGPRYVDEQPANQHRRHQPAHRLLVGKPLAEHALRWSECSMRTGRRADTRSPGRNPRRWPGDELVDVRRNDAPRALHEELHQEDADDRRERAEPGDPERHDDAARRQSRSSSSGAVPPRSE